jgi:hypothetical protein
MMCVHGDDFFYAGTQPWLAGVVQRIKARFPVGKEEEGDMLYLGMQVKTIRGHTGVVEEITVDQIDYIAKIKSIEVPEDPVRSEKCSSDMHTAFRALVGALLWCVTQSRPDIAFDVSVLTTKSQAPTIGDVMEANRVLKKIKRKEIKLRYGSMDGPLELVGFCDASWANVGNTGATIGGFFWMAMNPKTEQFHLIDWRCRKLRRICRSTFAAETMVASDALDEMFVLRQIWQSLMGEIPTTVLKTDCRSLYDHVLHRKQVTEKRLTVDLAAITESIALQELNRLEWVATDRQLADALTKHTTALQLIQSLDAGKIVYR